MRSLSSAFSLTVVVRDCIAEAFAESASSRSLTDVSRLVICCDCARRPFALSETVASSESSAVDVTCRSESSPLRLADSCVVWLDTIVKSLSVCDRLVVSASVADTFAESPFSVSVRSVRRSTMSWLIAVMSESVAAICVLNDAVASPAIASTASESTPWLNEDCKLVTCCDNAVKPFALSFTCVSRD